MNSRQKEAIQAQLDAEKKVLRELQQVYNQALKDVDERIRRLSMRSDMEPQRIQTIIYQRRFQEAIKAQLEDVLEKLHTQEYASVSEYLEQCYRNGYVGVVYDLQGQGIPLMLPIDQEQVTQAIQVDSKLSKSLYDSMGEDVKKLKTSVRAEVSRGIGNGSSWNDMAVKIAKSMKHTPFQRAFSRALNIARTEGHRVQTAAALDAQRKAKAAGADVVKQWNSTLDGDTRETHRMLDGQIREIEEDFEVDGKRASAPGHFGDPEEDCNCRCVLLQRAKWAMDEDELKTLQERAEFYGLDKTKDFEEFKRKYLNRTETEWARDNIQKISAHTYALQEYSIEGIVYKVDGKHVILDSTKHEKEVAEILGAYLEKKVYLIPRIVYPQGISTADYLIDDAKYDLKEPQGNGKNVFYNMVHKKKSQAENFVFDISQCSLNIEEVDEQILKLYTSKWTAFVNEVILLKNGEVTKRYNKQKKNR